MGTKKFFRLSWWFAAALFGSLLLRYENLLVIFPVVQAEADTDALSVPEQPTCDWSSCATTERDPALQEFTYGVGDGPQTTLVYVEPQLDSFYRKPGDDETTTQHQPTYKRAKPTFHGLAGKFINMSNEYLDFYWEDQSNGEAYLMTHYPPFSSDGTGTFPTHRFFLATEEAPDIKLNLWIVKDYPENIYVYDPYVVEGDPRQTQRNLEEHLDEEERMQYDLWKKTLSFHEQYRAFTGRSYLANYGEDGPRAPPIHYMWRADYFGQEHWVNTRETHFVKLPPMADLGRVQEYGSERILTESDPRSFQDYRARHESTNEPLEYMNMTLKVLSCAPRVFEIRNFLSPQEVDHIMHLAGGISLKESRTGNADEEDIDQSQSKVRTSKNSWIKREKSPIIDAIYRRAADLTRIDEALLRERSEEEHPELDHVDSMAETLQLVHYDVSQEYTEHHDFGYNDIDDDLQSQRFATILFYLNDDMVGGETIFPRWVNGETSSALKVKPEVGKAILFYDQLPDGNLDDFSQHAARPVIEGEKWLINLWIWDPEYA